MGAEPSHQAVEPGLYVCGWLKRGPSGIIGTNLSDAEETVASIAQDEQLGLLRSPLLNPGATARHEHMDSGLTKPPSSLKELLVERGVTWVDFEGWLRLDKAECDAGAREGRTRSKFTNIDEMLRVVKERC